MTSDAPPDIPPALAVYELTREQYARVREALARSTSLARAVQRAWGRSFVVGVGYYHADNRDYRERYDALVRWTAADPFLAREAPPDAPVDKRPCATDTCRDGLGECDDTCWNVWSRRRRDEARVLATQTRADRITRFRELLAAIVEKARPSP